MKYYNKTTYGILEEEIGLILPTYNNNKRNKRFIGTLLGSLVSGVIGLDLREYQVSYIIKGTMP